MRTILPLCLLLALGGCAFEPEKPTADQVAPVGPAVAVPGSGTDGLATVAKVYLHYQETHGRPPKSFTELASHALDASQPLPPGVGKLTIMWGAGMGTLCKDGPPAEIVLGWSPSTAGSVLVLRADGTTRTLSEQEFSLAKKATPPES